MNKILDDLRDADRRGVVPPQNWTTRAADKITRLKKAEAELAWKDEVVREAVKMDGSNDRSDHNAT